jgi:hypothetical protein
MARKHQILFDDDELEAASSWHGGGQSMLYAISSTGSLSLGTRRPHNDEENRPMTDDEWFAYIAANLEGEAEEALEQAKEQMKGASRQEKDELRSDIAALKSIIQKTQKASSGDLSGADDLTAAQREYIQLLEEDVRLFPDAYKASVRKNPFDYFMQQVEGLDDRDVRQMIREHRTELRRIKRLTGR